MKIVSTRKISGTCFDIVVEAGEIGRASKPGQFVHIKCGEENLLRRPISICDVQEGYLRLVFDVRGRGTEWLSERKKGDVLDIMGPLGHGFSDIDDDKTLLLMGGGIGTPPLIYAASRHKGKNLAILGFRCRSNAILIPDFKEVCDEVWLCTDDGSLGSCGFVDSALPRVAERHKIDCVMACGPMPMLRCVAQWAKENGIMCEVSVEERMGCGVGACLVCACETKDGRYRHVCKDGPVFNAEEVSL